MNNVFPESMSFTDPNAPEYSIEVIDQYIRYMCERIDFAMENMARAAASGVSYDIYRRLGQVESDVTTCESDVAALNANKVDKVAGKGLSDENYSLEEKEKLAGLSPTGGGHVILDEQGNEMTQRAKLQFENCTVTDDSTNDKTIVTAEEGMGFVLANRTLTFSNNIATVSDSRVTSSTYATLYFHDGCLAAAVSAGLTVDTSTGTITITAESTPSSSLTCDIVCENGTGGGSVSSLIAELRTDVDNIETLMGNTSISGIGNGTVTGAISTINTNLTAKAKKIYDNIASGATLAIDVTVPCLVCFGRASSSTLTVTAFVDAWGGIIYIQSSSGANLSYSNGKVSITNNFGGYGTVMIIT